jgi:hypothetical protein
MSRNTFTTRSHLLARLGILLFTRAAGPFYVKGLPLPVRLRAHLYFHAHCFIIAMTQHHLPGRKAEDARVR